MGAFLPHTWTKDTGQRHLASLLLHKALLMQHAREPNRQREGLTPRRSPKIWLFVVWTKAPEGLSSSLDAFLLGQLSLPLDFSSSLDRHEVNSTTCFWQFWQLNWMQGCGNPSSTEGAGTGCARTHKLPWTLCSSAVTRNRLPLHVLTGLLRIHEQTLQPFLRMRPGGKRKPPCPARRGRHRALGWERLPTFLSWGHNPLRRTPS